MCVWISCAQRKLNGPCDVIQLWLCASYRRVQNERSSRSHLFMKMYTFLILLFLKTITMIILSDVIVALFLCCELFLGNESCVGFVQGNWGEFQQSGDVGPWHVRQLQWESVERASVQTDCWLSQAGEHCSIRRKLQLQIIWRYICRLLSWTTIARISSSRPSFACNAYLTIFKALNFYVV